MGHLHPQFAQPVLLEPNHLQLWEHCCDIFVTTKYGLMLELGDVKLHVAILPSRAQSF